MVGYLRVKDSLIPLDGIRFGGGKDAIRTHDPQLDKSTLKWWSRDALDVNTKGDEDKVESQ